MELKRPRAVIFDWDNTLVNTWPVIHEALHNTFVEAGHEPWSLDKVKRTVSRSMRDYFPELFGERWKEIADVYRGHYNAIRLDKLKALEGAETVLRRLHDKSVYTAVASNKEGKNLRIETAHLGWDRYFGKIIGAADTPRDKPAPEPVMAALAGSGIEAGSEVWFVGDSEIDMQCAQVTGCTPLFYGELPDTPLTYPYARQVKNHAELAELLDYVLE